jgi:transcriptional regulator with XRE-family HTH domain
MMTAPQDASWKTALQLFGNVVRDRRKELGLRQRDLAGKTGLNISHIGEIENGKRSVNLETLFHIAAALEVPPSRLLHPIEQRPELYPSHKKGVAP